MKIHHAVLDGAAGVALSDVLLDRTPVARQVAAPARENRAPSRAAGFGDLAGAVLRHDVAQYARLVKHLPALAGTLAGIVRGARGPTAAPARRNLALAPRTPLNVSIAGERSFAAVSLSLAEAKGVARAHDATLNDVVLALCSGALRAWLARHGGIPREPLVAGMPLSVREPGNADYSSQVTMTLVNLATEIADPRARLVAIRDAAAAVKSTARRVKSLIPTDTPSLGAPWVLGGLAALYGRARLADTLPPIMSLVISNVPGPREPLYAAGARMRTYWPLSIVEHGVGLNITVVSYCDALDFGLVAATAAVPSVRPIARALEAAHAELVALTRAREPRTARGDTATAAPRRRGGARQGRNRG